MFVQQAKACVPPWHRSCIVDITITDFLSGFSQALDLLNPKKGQHGIRRAYIAMAILRQQGASAPIIKRVFTAALLYELGNTRNSELSHFHKHFSQISWLSSSASLVFNRTRLNSEGRLLDLVENFYQLAIVETDGGHYPVSAIETLCQSIGSRYSLDDILSLREIDQLPHIWWKLGSANLLEEVRALSPYSSLLLQHNDLIELATLLAEIIDRYCHHAVGFSAQVAELCVRLAEMYGFSHTGMEEMRLAGLLHGIGKLALPAALRQNADALKGEQRKRFKAYPLITRTILEAIPGMFHVAAAASSLHEQPDGRGFPDGLRKSQIDLSARIIAVAHAYVSLRTQHSEKAALSSANALHPLRQKAREGSLDGEVVDALATLLCAQKASVKAIASQEKETCPGDKQSNLTECNVI
jgi:HD-GYP domain-containing protein (c-di-GMP phosphodiesterase class II)